MTRLPREGARHATRTLPRERTRHAMRSRGVATRRPERCFHFACGSAVSVRACQRQLARRSGGRRAETKSLAMLPMEFDAGSVVGSINQDAVVTVHDRLRPGRVERHDLEMSTRY